MAKIEIGFVENSTPCHRPTLWNTPAPFWSRITGDYTPRNSRREVAEKTNAYNLREISTKI